MQDAPVAERVLDAAARLTCEVGWSGVTMAKVATAAGVSRQTVYNEYGVKPALGQAMVLRELDRFLAVVALELDRGDDLVDAIRAATAAVVSMAAGNPLLHTVLTSAHRISSGGVGADNDLLPFLTTDAGPLIAAAKATLADRVARFPDLGVAEERLDDATDVIVRLVLSYVMQPDDAGDPTDRTAARLAWMASRLLRPG